MIRDAGYKNLSFNLHLQGRRDRAGAAYMSFGLAVTTAPLALTGIGYGVSALPTLGTGALDVAGAISYSAGFHYNFANLAMQRGIYEGARYFGYSALTSSIIGPRTFREIIWLSRQSNDYVKMGGEFLIKQSKSYFDGHR